VRGKRERVERKSKKKIKDKRRRREGFL